MQSRWERWLETAERETQNVRAQVRQAPGLHEQAGQLKDDYQRQYDGAGSTEPTGTPGTTYAERPVDLRAGDPAAETRRI
jgi:hypothetical protein